MAFFGRVLRARSTSRPRPCGRRHANRSYGQRASFRRPAPACSRDSWHNRLRRSLPSSPHWPDGPSHQQPQGAAAGHCWSCGCSFTCASARRSTAHSPPPPTNNETPANRARAATQLGPRHRAPGCPAGHGNRRAVREPHQLTGLPIPHCRREHAQPARTRPARRSVTQANRRAAGPRPEPPAHRARR